MAKEKEDSPKEGEQKQVDKKNKKRMIIIGGVAVLVLVIVIGVVLYLTGSPSGPEEESPVSTESAPPLNPVKQVGSGPRTGQASRIGPMVQVDEFIVNLLDIDTTRYLKAAITLEVDSETTVEEVQMRMSQIRDAILLLTGNKNFSELRDLQGKMQLRAELLGHINTLLPKGQVRKIYFTNFVIQ